MNKYNLDKLVKIECNDFCQSAWYTFKEQKKIFGIVIRREGIYGSIFGDYFSFYVPRFHTLKNGLVYENPEVTLHYQSDHSKTYHFGSLDEAEKFVGEITAIGRWIN